MLTWILGFALGLAAPSPPVRFVTKTTYLNHARAVVTHTIDDSSKYVPAAIDAMDKYGIKATIFVSTEREPISQLWPRLRQAIANGHEIGSHSRRHQCKFPPDEQFCRQAYTDDEIAGSRDDILKNTTQPYVWSWCFPCGLCADLDWVQQKLAQAGYIVARNYPGEAEDRHLMPNLQTWDANPLDATYTQVAQKKGGIAKSGRTDVAVLNAKFDEVYGKGGIYNLMSHPQWLDYGPDQFYEQHLKYLGGRADIWYVPMGPLYAFHTERDQTQVRELAPGRFQVSHHLDPKIYSTSITLEFAGQVRSVRADGKQLPEKKGLTDRWNEEYFRRDGAAVYVTVHPNTTVELR